MNSKTKRKSYCCWVFSCLALLPQDGHKKVSLNFKDEKIEKSPVFYKESDRDGTGI